jgi:hypothetical protein
MRFIRDLGLLGLLLAPFGAGHADVESAWFSTERNALHALSEGNVLPVLECDGCDVDDPLHRTTGDTLRQVLDEFQINGLPATGTFVLRERVTPRYTRGMALQDREPSGCSPAGWSPSLTLWRYDLPSGVAGPVYTACLPFMDAVTTLRASCADCDLDRLQPIKPLVESLRESLGFWTGDVGSPIAVRSGELLVTDPTDRGFRRVDFRAYGSRVYLGPDQGQTEVVTLDMDPARSLAGTPPEGASP